MQDGGLPSSFSLRTLDWRFSWTWVWKYSIYALIPNVKPEFPALFEQTKLLTVFKPERENSAVDDQA